MRQIHGARPVYLEPSANSQSNPRQAVAYHRSTQAANPDVPASNLISIMDSLGGLGQVTVSPLQPPPPIRNTHLLPRLGVRTATR